LGVVRTSAVEAVTDDSPADPSLVSQVGVISNLGGSFGFMLGTS
jgi:hypothetical protein